MIRRLTALPLAFALVLVGTAGSAQTSPDAVITEFRTSSPYSQPWEIAAGPDGNLWFAENGVNSIGRSDTSGAIVEFPIPTANGGPEGIAAGPDGAMWFTETDANKIGRITMAGAIQEYPLPAGGTPYGITAGPDGNMWFAETYGFRIGKISMSGEITEYQVPYPPNWPHDVTTGPDGAMWVTAAGVYRVTVDGTFTNYYAGDTGQDSITAGPDGALWFSDVTSIGRITTSGDVRYFSARGVDLPLGITAGPGGIWFATEGSSLIGRLGRGGVFSFWPTPTRRAYPTGITVGSDGNIWFTENATGKIGRLAVPGGSSSVS